MTVLIAATRPRPAKGDGPGAWQVALPPARRCSNGRPQGWRRPRSSRSALGPRQRAQQLLFWPGGDLQRLLEDLGFERLLAEQALQLTDLVLQGPALGGGHHLLLGTGRRQRALG